MNIRVTYVMRLCCATCMHLREDGLDVIAVPATKGMLLVCNSTKTAAWLEERAGAQETDYGHSNGYPILLIPFTPKQGGVTQLRNALVRSGLTVQEKNAPPWAH